MRNPAMGVSYIPEADGHAAMGVSYIPEADGQAQPCNGVSYIPNGDGQLQPRVEAQPKPWEIVSHKGPAP